jgi:hypothetical protein
VNNVIESFRDGTSALAALFGPDGSGEVISRAWPSSSSIITMCTAGTWLLPTAGNRPGRCASQVPAVHIVMIEDDEGHARLIERNIRRAGVNNVIEHDVYGRHLAPPHGG